MVEGDISGRIKDALTRRSRVGEATLRSVGLRFAAEMSRSPITQPEGPVVSLTSYGHRVKDVHIAIESIAQGQVKPSRIILWLDGESAKKDSLRALRNQEQRGLEIKICSDLGPHKKYYPYLESCETISAPLVTADDDLVYPKWWLKGLVDEYMKYPDVLNCYRARRIQFEGQGLTSYRQWELTRSTTPSFCHVAGSGAGAIFSPALQRFIKMAGTGFLECCPRADDIWLHAQALRAGYKVRQIRSKEFRLLELRGSQKQALHLDNVSGGGNDRQISRTYDARDLSVLRGSAGEHQAIDRRQAEAVLSTGAADRG